MTRPDTATPDRGAEVGRANCHGCAHDADLGAGGHACGGIAAGIFWKWRHVDPDDRVNLPPLDADGCPGFSPRGDR